MVIVQAVHQETGGHNVAASYICLHLRKVAETPDGVSIFAAWQIRNHHIVVFAIEAVEKPDSSFLDRPGKSEARVNFVKRPSFLVLEGGEKVGGGETVMIVANSGL